MPERAHVVEEGTTRDLYPEHRSPSEIRPRGHRQWRTPFVSPSCCGNAEEQTHDGYDARSPGERAAGIGSHLVQARAQSSEIAQASTSQEFARCGDLSRATVVTRGG
jgi:hypothetical protein